MILRRRWLDEIRTSVRAHLAQHLARCVDEVLRYDPNAGRVAEFLRNYALRGDGLGSLLAVAAVRAIAGDEAWPAAAPLGTAVELLSRSTLVRDDVIDEDDHRWGEFSLHVELRRAAEDRGRSDSERCGLAETHAGASILASWGYVALAALPPDRMPEIVRRLAEGQAHVEQSQLVDLEFEVSFPRPADWERMARRRAAAHLSAAIGAGATLADTRACDAWEEGAQELGILYDIRADLLDCFGNPTDRRVVRRDLMMGKKPLVMCAALERAEPGARHLLERVLQRDNSQLEEVLTALRHYGIPTVCASIAQHRERAIEAFRQAAVADGFDPTFFLEVVAAASRVPRGAR